MALGRLSLQIGCDARAQDVAVAVLEILAIDLPGRHEDLLISLKYKY
jgi:hypothetical protein